MITIVITNRNRNLLLVERSLVSLSNQSNQDFLLYLVDYGSHPEYLEKLKQLLDHYPRVNFISCPVSNQLWNKSRAINIVLKLCTTPYFFVGDIDMIYAPDFVQKLHINCNNQTITYFKVGFLGQRESGLTKDFKDYSIDFVSNEEATGMTLYPTHLLRTINGYDEFYHGWGAEDTDVHARLVNLGYEIKYFDKEILLLHQWHAKQYRSKKSAEPFHAKLEKINHNYLKLVEKMKVTKSNQNFGYGIKPLDEEYEVLKKPDIYLEVNLNSSSIEACFAALTNSQNKVVSVIFQKKSKINFPKKIVKYILGKSVRSYLTLEEANDMILFLIISNFRNNPYAYELESESEKIILTIKI